MNNSEHGSHIPVMLKEVITALNVESGKTYLDCTFGAGGYSSAILERADCKLYAIDRDPEVKKYADILNEKYQDKFKLITGNFSDFKALLVKEGVEKIDGIVMDIGVSSMQIDQGERGFSFAKSGPLDMRMSQDGVSAADFVNNYSESEIANVIYNYGGERRSRRIASAIIRERSIEPITTTNKLADIVRSVVPKGKSKIDPATRTFQAIRIWVNDELEQLKKALKQAEEILNIGGRLVVVSFHSLEDVIVKQFLKEKSGKNESVSRYMPMTESEDNITFKLLKSKAIAPSEEEVSANIRSRSAKLRAAIRV